MIKILLIAILILKSFHPFCQDSSLHADSLSKYSYSLLGLSNNPNVGFGTCFFINYDNNLYLVTAKHTLYTCDTLAKKEYPAFKSASVFIPEPLNAIPFLVPNIVDTCFGAERDIDLLVLKVDKNRFKGVNTVEKFLLPPFSKLGDIQIFGQGMRADSSFVGLDKQHSINLPAKSYKIYTSMPVLNNMFIDSIHYIIDMESLRIDKWLKGFSGSPAFLQNSETKQWRLLGVLVQGLVPVSKKQKGAILAVKPEYIFQAIQKRQ